MAEEVIQIDVNSLQANPLQPRGVITPESLVDLVDSIREHGILEPLVVAQTPAGYQIIAGERRWRAAKLGGISHVPCIIRETSTKGMLEMSLVENVQRTDLNALDRGKGFERLMSEFGLTTSEIAVRIGKSVAYISNSLRLLTLPDALKDGLLSGLISEGHARALAAIDDTSLMVEAYKIILRESGSVRRAEELARRMKVKSKQDLDRPHMPHITLRIVSEEIDRLQEEMQEVMNKGITDDTRKSSVKLIRSRRETRIVFIFKGGLEETEGRLQKVYKSVTS